MDASEIWWKRVTGPVRLTEQIANTIINEEAICFMIPFDLPWRRDLRYCVEGYTSVEGIGIEFVDFEDEFNDENIGIFLLKRYGTEEDMASFRPHKDTIEQYLQERKILSNKVVWVKGIPDHSVNMWLTFLKQFKSTKRMHGQFVIETKKRDISSYKIPSNVNVINYFDYVNKDDTYLFASILASLRKSKYLHQYITHVASSMCEFDSEILADYIENTNFEWDCPIQSFKKLFESNYQDTDRGIHFDHNGYHAFYLLRNKKEDILENRLWSAQLRVIFPLIEQERLNFIKQYIYKLQECLPLQHFNEKIDNPYDLELGTISYLITNGDLNVRYEDRLHIFFVRDIRNKLAHMNICTVDEINKILSIINIR